MVTFGESREIHDLIISEISLLGRRFNHGFEPGKIIGRRITVELIKQIPPKPCRQGFGNLCVPEIGYCKLLRKGVSKSLCK